MTKTLLSFGHGYSARALTRLLLPEGWAVIGTTRSEEKAETLRSEGVDPLVWPGADMTDALARATHLLISADQTNTVTPFWRRWQTKLWPKRLIWNGRGTSPPQAFTAITMVVGSMKAPP